MEDSLEQVIADKKSAMVEKLEKRKAERLACADKRKTEKSEMAIQSENVQYFTTEFGKIKSQVEQLFKESNNFQGDTIKLTSHFDKISKLINGMQKMLTDSIFFLPSYDIKTAQQVLNTHQETLKLQNETLMPKKKFAFKGFKKEKEKDKINDNHTETDSQVVKASLEQPPKFVLDHSYESSYNDLQNQTLELRTSDVNGKFINLQRLENCVILLEGCPGSVHINQLRGCKVNIGPASTSIMVDSCQEVEFNLACQQLRVHSTMDCDFYVFVISRSIIENCQRLRFAPYQWTYPSLENDFASVKFDSKVNNWKLVDDFNWLSTDKPSPNWSYKNEEKQ